MEKMFKRTLLGAAVMTAALASTSANAAIDLLDGNVQMYGQAAGGLIIANPDGGDSSVTADIESRIGFRGKVEFDNFGPAFVWQMEGGNANSSGGSLGMRDTFLGLDFDGLGSVKFGRQLVAAYNYVDWPHSNPGIGGVFDWNNDINAAYQDRADNVIRFDSANFGGFNFQATVSGMEKNVDQAVYSVAASYTADAFTVHAGHYTQDNIGKKYFEGGWSADDSASAKAMVQTLDSNAYSIVGGALYLGDITLTGAAKYMTTDWADGTSYDQWAYSATAQYVAGGKWLYKVGAAYSPEAETDGKAVANTEDLAVTGRIGYLLPSAILYMDVRYSDKLFNEFDKGSKDDKKDASIAQKSAKGTNVHLGVEYYF